MAWWTFTHSVKLYTGWYSEIHHDCLLLNLHLLTMIFHPIRQTTLKTTHSWPVWNWLYNSGGSSNNHDFSGSRRGQLAGTSWPLRTQQLTWLPRLYSLWYVHNKRVPHPLRGRGFKPPISELQPMNQRKIVFIVRRGSSTWNARRLHRAS